MNTLHGYTNTIDWKHNNKQYLLYNNNWRWRWRRFTNHIYIIANAAVIVTLIITIHWIYINIAIVCEIESEKAQPTCCIDVNACWSAWCCARNDWISFLHLSLSHADDAHVFCVTVAAEAALHGCCNWTTLAFKQRSFVGCNCWWLMMMKWLGCCCCNALVRCAAAGYMNTLHGWIHKHNWLKTQQQTVHWIYIYKYSYCLWNRKWKSPTNRLQLVALHAIITEATCCINGSAAAGWWSLIACSHFTNVWMMHCIRHWTYTTRQQLNV